METLEQKVARLTSELEALSAQVPRNETQINLTSISLDEAKAELQQEQAAQVRIQDATEQAAFFLDTLEVEGLTMRQLCAGESEYQLLRIAMQSRFMKMAEDNSDQIRLLETQHAENMKAASTQVIELQGKLESQVDLEQTITELRTQLNQAVIERNDFEGKLVNAGKEIERLNGQCEELRREIATGARDAYKVINSEQQQAQMKDLADKIKATKVKVTNMEFTDYTHVTYTAILVQDLPSEGKKFGDRIEFPSIFKSKYIEIKDAAEVERFRAEYESNQKDNADLPLGDATTADVAQGTTFPELPKAELPATPNTVDESQSSGEVPAAADGAVTRAEFEALKKRLVEVEKVCNIGEETAA